MTRPPPVPDRLVAHLSTQEGYDRWASIYDHEDNPLIVSEDRELGSMLGSVEGLELLDLGCGTGRRSFSLAEQGARVTAVDFSDGMLERALGKPGAERIRFVKHDLRQPLPFEPRSFDRVTSFLAIEHVEALEPLFAEVRRVTRPGGLVVVSMMHPAMMLLGIEARFVDPVTGQEIRPASAHHQLSDYVMAALHAGLELDELREHAVDTALIAASPRAARYEGWPLLALMRLRVDGEREHPG